MAVKDKLKLILFIVCFLVSGVNCASQSNESKVVQLATTNYKNALANYEKQLKYCADETEKNRLDPVLFNDIKLTQLQLNISIGRFHFMALSHCVTAKFGVYLIQRGIYRDTLREFKVKFDSEDPKYYNDYEIFSARYQRIEVELKYLSYPKLERDKLEKIPELKQVFNLFSVIGG